MSLKQEMYKKQFGFVRNLLAFVIVLVLLYGVFPYQEGAITQHIPN